MGVQWRLARRQLLSGLLGKTTDPYLSGGASESQC